MIDVKRPKPKDTGKLSSLFGAGKTPKTLLLLLGLAAGIALILLSSWDSDSSKQDNPKNTDEVLVYGSGISELTSHYEKKIKDICAKIIGSDDCEVLITLYGGYEYIYAQNHDTTIGNSSKESKEYLTIGSGKDQSTVLIKEVAPDIKGIAIVCRGGSEPSTQKQIIDFLTAAFNITSNKIYVTGSK